MIWLKHKGRSIERLLCLNCGMRIFFLLLLVGCGGTGRAQTKREDIHTDFVLYNRRVALEKDLRERMIGRHFSLPLDSNSEDGYLSGCWAVEQFLFDGPEVRQGFDHLFAGYEALGYDTRRALLESVYAVEPDRYRREEAGLLAKEGDPHLWALCAVYLYRADSSTGAVNDLKIRLVERFPGYDTVAVLHELMGWLGYRPPPLPALEELFVWAGKSGARTIFSFQRRDRDFPGLAVVQDADGRFVRDADGKLQVFEQLARSGPGLPYFLTNGNTPQGVYSIQGMDISRSPFIGPTPNLQLILPFEDNWEHYFHQDSLASATPDSLQRYLALLPPSWRNFTPMMEAWSAGHIGRTAIIAHGTTIDPEYYRGRPFYPLTPTMGCLCAKELWNVTSGHLLVSEQNNLVNAFLSTPEIGRTPKSGGRRRSDGGFLVVVDVDDRREAVSRAEVEGWVRAFESKKPSR
jgi:hypothetical protein